MSRAVNDILPSAHTR